MALGEILVSLAILLVFAKLFGEIAERVGVASLVGELIAGILVGPVLGFVVVGEFMTDFVTLSVIFLLFMAGLEVKYEEIKSHVYSASALAFLGGFFSFLFGFAVGMVFFNDVLIAFAIGTVIISTSNGTMFLFLMKSGEFNSKVGKVMIATTIADDVVGILFLSFFSVYIKSHAIGLDTVFQLFLISVGFYFVMFTVGSKLMNTVLNMAGKFLDQTAIFAIPVGVAFFLAYVTENIGLSIAAGAFLAGVAIANSQYSESVISPKVTAASNGFFIPLFYAVVGTALIFEGLNYFFVAALIIAAMLGKIIGIGYISRFFGIKKESSKLFGLVMIPRGNENIALVQIVLFLGVISYTIYTSIVFAMIATVLLTPVMIKLFYKR